MAIVTQYRNTAEMCKGGGWEWLGRLVDTAGLPLEVIHIVNGRVHQIDALDYEEGSERPMTRRSVHWFDVFERPPARPVSVRCAIVAVYPDGGCHVVASGDEWPGESH